MKNVKVKDGQTLADIAMQELGDFERIFEVARLNNVSITDEVSAGDSVAVGDVALDKRSIAIVFLDPSNLPASALKGDSCAGIQEGIEFWSIEFDFKIS